MADPQIDEIAGLEERKTTLERRRRIVETQLAKLGSTAPSSLFLEKEEIEQELSVVVAKLERLQSEATLGGAPYRGLQAYGEEDAELFHGRGALVEQLLDKLAKHGFLAVLGPSGSGKSSLARAGLLPRLKSGALGRSWRYVVLKPGRYPLMTLTQELRNVPNSERLQTSYEEQLGLFRANDDELLRAAYRLSSDPAERLALIVDQFEELWTHADESFRQEREPFIRQLVTAAEADNSRVAIVLTLRDDFFAQVGMYPNLARLIDAHFVRVGAPTAAELEQMIQRPAELAGCGFEPGLAQELVKQAVGRPGALPLLQYTLEQLWKRRTDTTLSWQAFNEISRGDGIARVLVAKADEVFDNSRAPDALRALLIRLVLPSEETAGARRGVPLADLVSDGEAEADVRALIEPLVDAGLLTISMRTDARQRLETVELAHEALIRAWPRFQGWIDDARADLRFQLRLEEAAREWVERDKIEGYLWPKPLLDQAGEWRGRTKPRLNERELRFLEASQDAYQARVEAERAVAEERRAARQTRQMLGSALGAGAGYGLAFVYLAIASSAGAFLLGTWAISLDVLPFVFMMFFGLGQFVGFGIGVSQAPAKRRASKLAGSSASALVVGGVSFLMPAWFYIPPSDLGISTVMPFVVTGALLAVGVCLGIGVSAEPKRRIVHAALAGMLAGAIAHLTGNFAHTKLPNGLAIAIIGGGVIGGVTGGGLLLSDVWGRGVGRLRR